VGGEHPRITVVNDNPDFLELMRDILQDATWPTTTIDGGRENALELIEASEPELVIADLRLGGIDELRGLDILRHIRRSPSLRGVPVIVCSADRAGLEAAAEELDRMERVATLPKPFAMDELYRLISQQTSAE
jgi:CheY-like chemotaxis protein